MDYARRLIYSVSTLTQRSKQRTIFLTTFAVLILLAMPIATAMSIAPDGINLVDDAAFSDNPQALLDMCGTVAFSDQYEKCFALASGLVTGELSSPQPQLRNVQDLSGFATGLSVGGQQVLEAYVSGQVGTELSALSTAPGQDLQAKIDERAQKLEQTRLHYKNVQDWLNAQTVSDEINTKAQYHLSLAKHSIEDADMFLAKAQHEFLPRRILFALNDLTNALEDAGYFMNKAVHLLEAETVYDQDLDLDAAITGGDFNNFATFFKSYSSSRSDLNLNGVTNYQDLLLFLEAYNGPLPSIIDLSSSGGGSSPNQIPVVSTNSGTSVVVADITGDGFVNLEDLFALLAALKGYDLGLGYNSDVTGDGKVDFFDMSLLLANFDHDNPGFPEGSGDVDGDGNVSANDLDIANTHAVAGTYDKHADVNNDSVVDVWDVLQIIGAWSGGYNSPSLSQAIQKYNIDIAQLYCDWLDSRFISEADFNIDGDVDFCDWKLVAENQGSTTLASLSGDVTGDGIVDVQDIEAFASRYTGGDCGTPSGVDLLDITGDGVVDYNDFGQALKYREASSEVEPFTNGDVTGNGVVDDVDIYLLMHLFENGLDLLDKWHLTVPANPFPLTTSCNGFRVDLTQSPSKKASSSVTTIAADASSLATTSAPQHSVSVDKVLAGTLGWCLDCQTDLDCDFDVDAQDVRIATLNSIKK